MEEDYVSFETAKLLKEKGFDEPCYQYYLTTKTLHTTFHDRMHVEEEPFFNSSELNGLYEVADKTLFEDICSAPTLQLAMKWLRDEKHYYIQIMLDSWACGEHLGYYVVIQKTDSDFEMMLQDAVDEVFYQTYEQACEAAIKYCLEHLI